MSLPLRADLKVSFRGWSLDTIHAPRRIGGISVLAQPLAPIAVRAHFRAVAVAGIPFRRPDALITKARLLAVEALVQPLLPLALLDRACEAPVATC